VRTYVSLTHARARALSLADPNRNFVPGSPCDECNAVLDMLGKLKDSGVRFNIHVDLHEV